LFMSALQVHAAEGNGKPFRPRQALLVRLAIGSRVFVVEQLALDLLCVSCGDLWRLGSLYRPRRR